MLVATQPAVQESNEAAAVSAVLGDHWCASSCTLWVETEGAAPIVPHSGNYKQNVKLHCRDAEALDGRGFHSLWAIKFSFQRAVKSTLEAQSFVPKQTLV